MAVFFWTRATNFVEKDELLGIFFLVDVCFFFLQTPHLGGPGLRTCGLSDDECQLVQRFDPTKVNVMDTGGSQCNEDTIGFFIAKFIKKKIL